MATSIAATLPCWSSSLTTGALAWVSLLFPLHCAMQSHARKHSSMWRLHVRHELHLPDCCL